MTLIDTHAHIYVTEFAEDRQKMMNRAAAAGVGRIIMPGIDSSTHQSMLEMEKDYPGQCQSMMGLHPCSVKETYNDELKLIETWLGKRKFVAVGEIGLDFYWDISFKEQQYEAFHRQIEWALHYNIPIAIHSRNATDECIKTVQEHQNGKLRGVFHCFSGTSEQARQVIDAGFYLGIGGVLTFKNAGLDKVLEDIDLSHLVLETDAPYLAPVPYRGKRNESSYLPYVVKKLAGLKQQSEEEIAAITTVNAQNLFGL